MGNDEEMLALVHNGLSENSQANKQHVDIAALCAHLPLFQQHSPAGLVAYGDESESYVLELKKQNKNNCYSSSRSTGKEGQGHGLYSTHTAKNMLGRQQIPLRESI